MPAHCVNFTAMRYQSTSFSRIVADRSHGLKARITRCDLSDRFFGIQARSLCEFQSDEIRVNEFHYYRNRQIGFCNTSLIVCMSERAILLT